MAICVAAVVALVVAVYFDAFENFERWAQRYERWQLDEIVVVPLVFGVAFGIYFWRRRRELKESEQRFRSLVQNASDVILIMGTDRTVRYISPSVRRVLGYEPEEVIGKDNFTPVHPDDVARVQDSVAYAVSNPGTASPMELRLRHRDGTWRHVESICTSLLDDPAVGGIVINSRDVTERRKAEGALRESEEQFRLLAENAQDLIYRYRFKPTPGFEYVSPSATEITGYTPEEHYADPELGLKMVHPDDRHLIDEAVRSPGAPITLRWQHKEGRVLWTEQRNKPIYDEAGELIAIEGIARDVTERKKAEEALRESEASLAEAQRIAHLGSWEYESEKHRVYWSDETYRIFGFTPQQFVPTRQDFLDTVHPDDRLLIGEDMAKLLRGERLQDGGIEFRIVRADGQVRFVQGQRSAELDKADGLIKMFGTVQDITERKRAEEELRNSEGRNRTILEAIPDLIFRFGRDGEYLDFQAKDAAGLYLPREEIVGKNVREVMPPELVEPALRAIAETLDTGEMQLFEHRLPLADGPRDYEARLVPSGPGEVLAIVRDVTERKALQRRLEYQAFHDDLTGLPNRVLFMDLLEHALARSERRESRVAVLFVDLDGIEAVNDSLGHWAGDELLVGVAGRLEACLRPGDTVARFGGEEFVVLLEDVGQAVAIEIAERVIEELRREPFVLEGREVFIAPRVGIAVSGYTELGAADLLRRADLALHRARERGEPRHGCYDPDLDARLRERLELENDLRRALERREFRVFYQPKVSIISGEIVGMEALVRWEHPERGLISPAEFIPVAEETGLIVPVGRWVLGEACRQAREWQVRHSKDPSLAMNVNLSASQFRQPDLAEEVAAALEESGLDPCTLTLEITESVAMDDAESAIATMEKLKGLEVRIAVDDFGTGHSSLSYLKRFPVDVLKIDRSFVGGLGKDPKDERVIEAAMELARTFGLTVIAEGVESGEQLGRLRRMGCDLAQGCYFWGPLPVEAAEELLAAYNTY